MTSHSRSRPEVEVRDEGVRTREVGDDAGRRAARERFGGIDVPATLVGMLAALALLMLLAGLIGAALGAIGYQTGLEGNADDLSVGALAGGIAAIFVAFVVGGWAAARIARYDGIRNGLMAAVWALVLAAVLAGLGAWLGSEYNVFERVDLPNWFSRDALTVAAVTTGLASVVAMLVGGALGGLWGERYHRRADATIASVRPGGLVHTAGTAR